MNALLKNIRTSDEKNWYLYSGLHIISNRLNHLLLWLSDFMREREACKLYIYMYIQFDYLNKITRVKRRDGEFVQESAMQGGACV